MKLSILVAFYSFLQVSVLYINVHGQCPGTPNNLPSISNAFRSSTSNLKFSNNSIYGSFDVQCNEGYALSPAIGGRITCLSSGSWSEPLPQCTFLGACDVPTLFNWAQTTSGISLNQSLMFIQTNSSNGNQAWGGSNITIQCATGLKNVGGPLTIVCTNANKWTTFPQCVSSTASAPPSNTPPAPVTNAGMAHSADTPAATAASTKAATVATPAGCPATGAALLFTRGYLTNAKNIVINSDNTTTSSVMVSCEAGYIIDSVSQGTMNCNKGTWSARPYCTQTGRCSLQQLIDKFNNPDLTVGLTVVDQHLSTNTKETNGGVLQDSYLSLACQDGYVNNDDNLKLTCGADSQWSTFPSCTEADDSVEQ